MLLVLETHPVQYHAPLYRAINQRHGIPVVALYQSDRSIKGYRDREFGTHVAWDTDLATGYESIFASGTSSLDTVRSLKRILAAKGPKAVLMIGYQHPFYRASIACLWSRKIPLLFRGETTDHARERSGVKSAMRDFLLRLFYRRCSKVLYIGQRSKLHYQRLRVPDRKLGFSPYCVDANSFRLSTEHRAESRSRTRRELGILENESVFMFSGKLTFRKGVDLLVDAVSRRPADRVLLFVGDGEMRLALQEHSRSLGVRAKFVGFKNQTELSDYYHAADALVLPSRSSETWGLVVNEAMLHGLPVVVSDAVGCAPDLVTEGETGVTFSAGSADDLAAALDRAGKLIGNNRSADACRQRIANYGVEQAASGVATAYCEIETSQRC